MGYRSPLYNAVKNDSPELMQLLFNYNANDMLYVYIQNNNVNMINHLLRDVKINNKNSNGATLLFFAVERNNYNIAKLLLENGADPNICNHKERNESPLYQAITNKNYKMVKLLIKYKADYNHRLTINAFVGPTLGESIMGRADRICWTSEICDYLKSLNAQLFYEWD
jgi:ankyrin repeat protein